MATESNDLEFCLRIGAALAVKSGRTEEVSERGATQIQPGRTSEVSEFSSG
jgi:hypothetical protein